MPQEPSATPEDDSNHLSFTLSRSPESDEETSPVRQSPPYRPAIRRESLPLFSLRNRDGANYKDVSDLHPYVQSLTIADLESCIALENTAFPPEERCSPEKVSDLRLLQFSIIRNVLPWLLFSCYVSLWKQTLLGLSIQARIQPGL